MTEIKLQAAQQPLNGEIEVPGDKSISHRAVILGSLAEGTTMVSHFLDGEDCMRTVDAFRAMGVSIDKEGTTLTIKGNGINTLKEPIEPLYFGNSGTTARLMFGLLAGLPVFTAVYGDPSLSKRPMDRVGIPLREMGASFHGREEGSYLPLSIRGKTLKGINYLLPVKSAQVKSAILLAGLHADGETKVTESTPTRNHTENMLKAFGADLITDGHTITVTNKKSLTGTDIYVPGDISSAAFFLVAAAIVPGSELILRNVGLNETRTGIINVLKAMNADIQILSEEIVGGELLGDIRIAHRKLQSTTIEGDVIPRLIDEIPVIALLATQAKGTTIIRDAEELKVKETDRIAAVTELLTTLGAKVEATEDGMIIHGETALSGGKVASYDDHRIAMTAVIASLVAYGEVNLDDASSIAISYPKFFDDLSKVNNNV